MSGDAGFGTFTIVDVETSGLSAARHRVLSVAALTLDGAGRVAEEFHTLLDPGCDPGPVHIHGLTREILRGAPRFAQIRERLAPLLTDRVLVAHNAEFDYGFLAREFDLTGTAFPVGLRLCTLALARRVAPPTPDCRLDTLATHYGVPRVRSHDALDDARVLAGVLRGLMADAVRLGLEPPVLRCPPKQNHRGGWHRRSARSGPKQPCPYLCPGRLSVGGPLVQGMKIAFTGDTSTDRDILIQRAEAAGLDVTGNVSRLTSALVTNSPGSSTTKARRAVELGTPTLTELGFLALLEAVRPGVRKDERRPRPRGGSVRGNSDGPLAGRRVLVLGGTHAEAARHRARIAELGGLAAVDLAADVTDVLALPGAESDPRYTRSLELGLPVHGGELLDPAAEPRPASPESTPDPAVAVLVAATPHPTNAATPENAERAADATVVSSPPDTVDTGEPARHHAVTGADEGESVRVLLRGEVVDLPIADHGETWTVRTQWAQGGPWEVDVVAFLLDADERVTADEDFVFYNQPVTAGVRLLADGPSENTVEVDLDALPAHCRRIVVAAALDGVGVTFGAVGPVEVRIGPGGESAPLLSATADAATDERSLVLTELYLRGEVWRVRAVGQGYPTGLAELARGYGVDVADG